MPGSRLPLFEFLARRLVTATCHLRPCKRVDKLGWKATGATIMVWGEPLYVIEEGRSPADRDGDVHRRH
jgi:hypothetical protein